jgi:hypothetical protein
MAALPPITLLSLSVFVFGDLFLTPLFDASHSLLLSRIHYCRNPRIRRIRLRSALATGRSLEKERRTRFDFLRRRWLRLCFRRRSFPLPVILKRFAVALCVFILGIVLNTSLRQLSA